MFQKIKFFISMYPHIWTTSYMPFYLICFMILENTQNRPYHIISFPLDRAIPFCEYFVIPYFLWFIYIAVVFIWLFFKDRRNYYRYIIFLYTGMTIFLIASAIYPNGHLLRPTEFERNNIFVKMVCSLYQIDTSTNILPSIHVFNSIATHIAIINSPGLIRNKWTVHGSRFLCMSIILSTLFLKQHSCIDVAFGIVLSIILHNLIYEPNLKENIIKNEILDSTT